ncbi:hypothetical protein DLAC_01991 [Tieghemostelium lacteum]|uniref:Uncharacterized protein n=1 Tax=Tieghemostelium lacteum TaxID=361077 RepID=A0A152A5M7_TIELA|nr:hypothetical protein DLAC_01991 [Tieghemostelium lacteum]|eukprot:KYR01401.1 hypothetical protein DLAC_01991 [Tieghemostelium lacteum]
MPLPLLARKSLRDNEPHLKDAVEQIQKALGVEWTFEFDFETLLAKAEDSLKADCGDIFYKNIAKYVANNIEGAAKDEMTKEALIEANSNCKIAMVENTDKKDSTYWKYRFNNGTLELVYNRINVNLSDIQYFKIHTVIPTPGVYSLPARLNIKQNKEKFDEALESIKAITKNDWTYDEESLETVYKEIDPSYQASIGDIFAEVITNVARNIKSRCADDMVLEAFNEICTNNKIVFKCNKKQSDYWSFIFEKGDLIISFRSIANVSDAAYFNFEKLL